MTSEIARSSFRSRSYSVCAKCSSGLLPSILYVGRGGGYKLNGVAHPIQNYCPLCVLSSSPSISLFLRICRIITGNTVQIYRVSIVGITLADDIPPIIRLLLSNRNIELPTTMPSVLKYNFRSQAISKYEYYLCSSCFMSLILSGYRSMILIRSYVGQTYNDSKYCANCIFLP